MSYNREHQRASAWGDVKTKESFAADHRRWFNLVEQFIMRFVTLLLVHVVTKRCKMKLELALSLIHI